MDLRSREGLRIGGRFCRCGGDGGRGGGGAGYDVCERAWRERLSSGVEWIAGMGWREWLGGSLLMLWLVRERIGRDG